MFTKIKQFLLLSATLLLVSTAVSAASVPETFSHIVKSQKNKVVHISTTRMVKVDNRRNPLLEQFFNLPRQNPNQPPIMKRQAALGSGFIISSDGYIVTNNHVIAEADKIQVILTDERRLEAKLVGKDKRTDLALLKVELKNSPYAEFGDSSKIEIGDWVLAIGNPLGLDSTVTSGILSARGRDIFAGTAYGQFLQTDAAINPGNSGGPLFNMSGKVIGINTAIVAGGQGLGFAVPSNLAGKVIDQLKKYGVVKRGWFGVGIQELSRELAESYELPENFKGVVLTSIGKDSPADKAGLKEEDILFEVDGRRVNKSTDLQQIVAETTPGTDIRVKFYRNGKMRETAVKVGLAPGDEVAAKNAPQKYGMQLVEITPQIRNELQIREASGLLIYGIEQYGIAWDAGLRKGDIIIKADRKTINNLDDFFKTIENRKKNKGKRIALSVIRGNRKMFLPLPIK